MSIFSKRKNNKGFTLVELVIVVAILAILVGVLAPQYTKYVEKARKAADLNNLNHIVDAIKIAIADPEYQMGSKTGSKIYYQITIGEIFDFSNNLDGIEIQREPGDDDNDQVLDALNEYTGLNFRQIGLEGTKRFFNDTMKIKSHKWGVAEANNGKEESDKLWGTYSGISAKVTLDNSTGSVKVIYSDNVVNYLDHGTIDDQT